MRELAASAASPDAAYYDEVVGRFCLANCVGAAASQIALVTPVAPIEPAPTTKIVVPNEPLPADLPIRPGVAHDTSPSVLRQCASSTSWYA